jgi:hypothetical protein
LQFSDLGLQHIHFLFLGGYGCHGFSIWVQINFISICANT